MEDYPRTLMELERRFSSEDACREYLEALRWPRERACDVRQTEKKWADFQPSAFHYSLVSEQPKLRQRQPAKTQACPDAALDGPQSRLAPIELATDSSCPHAVHKHTIALLHFCYWFAGFN